MATRRTGLLLAGVAAATIGVYVLAFVLSTTSDRQDTLDVGPVPAAASRACAELRIDLDALPPLGAGAPLADRLARLAVQDEQVRELIASVRTVEQPALRADVPAEQWLGDWEALARARRAYAEAGAAGPFTPPVADGRPLPDRMGRVGLPACTVPPSLTTAP